MNNPEVPLKIEDTPVPFSSLASLRDAHHELLQRRRLSGETSEFWLEVDAFIRQGQVTGALLDSDEDRWACQSILDYWANMQYHAGLEPPDATLADFDPAEAPELDDAQCPYVGLDAFQESDQKIFLDGSAW